MITLDGEIRNFEPYPGKQEKIHAAHSSKISASAATNEPEEPSQPIARAELRRAAIAADAATSTNQSLALLWRELARGKSVVVDGFFSHDRCYLVVEYKTEGSAPPIEGRRLEIVESMLSGMRQKHIAIDLALAASTVALNSRLALESLGVTCKPSRAHPILMLAASSMSSATTAFARCANFALSDARQLRVISLPRPDQQLNEVLPPAELSVIRLLAEGLPYAEIAKIRGTAMRTVANQITAVFRRLQVSGRNELVQRLLASESALGPVPCPETLAPPETVRTPTAAGLQSARRSA